MGTKSVLLYRERVEKERDREREREECQVVVAAAMLLSRAISTLAAFRSPAVNFRRPPQFETRVNEIIKWSPRGMTSCAFKGGGGGDGGGRHHNADLTNVVVVL